MSKMNIQVIFCLAFAFFISGAHMATITITNKCTQTIWPATLTGNGAQLSTTGFELAQGASRSIDIPSPWTAGRIWARTGCSSASGTFTCATGDCGRGPECQGLSGAKPHTLVEITIDPANNKDTIDVSLVDGFNLPVSITPQGGTGNECVTTSCSANINAACPAVLQVKGSDGSVIACKDACTQFNEPKYCCTGDFCCTPDKCPPTEYSQFFKGQCPQAYSYAKDDQTSTFACTTGGNFAITFCP